MPPAELEEIIKRPAQAAPSWFTRLQQGGFLPPNPPDGWGRWWDAYGGYVWLLLVAAGLQLVVVAAERKGKSR